jgi:hypothetical protein
LNTVNGSLGAVAPTASSKWGTTFPIVDIGHAFNNINGQFLAADQNLVASLYATRDSFRQSPSSLTSYLQQLAQNVLTQMVNEDTPQKGGPTVAGCMAELIRQMNVASASVNQPTVSATVASVVATGDSVVVASVIGPGGIQRDYIFAEVINVLCTQSSIGTSGYVDTYSVQGNPAASGPLNWDWPTQNGSSFNGSGASTSVSSCDAKVVSPQLLTNPFQTFVAIPNTPDGWTYFIGVAGTDFFAAGSVASYFGTNALQITGTGSALLDEARQPLTSLLPSTVYAINFWIKASGAIAAGVIEADLYDTVGNATLTDASSTACAVSVGHGSITTSYTSVTGFVRTPAVLPNNGAGIVFRIKVTTAITNGVSVYIDLPCIQPATQIYVGGPFMAIFAGKTRAALNDKYTITTANSALTDNTTLGFQKTLLQLFSPPAYALQFPSSGSPTIADSLIT